MREWFEKQVAAGLPAFAGTTVSGTLALQQELLNELLAKWLTHTAETAAARGVDLSHSVRVIKSAKVRVETGTVLVDFEIAI